MIELHLTADTPEQLVSLMTCFQSNIQTEPVTVDLPKGNTITEAKVTPKQEIPTKSQVRDALMKVNEKHGLVKAEELLKVFGVSRLSDLAETDYVQFLDNVNEVMK